MEFKSNILATGTITGSNLSGTNTGDQDLSGYLLTTGKAADSNLLDGINSTSFLRSDANDETSSGIKTWFGGALDSGSSARIQVNGFQRTGNIYLHSGGNAPDNVRNSDYLNNINGDLHWNKNALGNGKVWTSSNDGSGSGLDADTLDGQHASAFLTSLPSHNHDDRYYTESESEARYVKEGGITFNGVYPMVVRVSARNIYSHPNITFTGSNSSLFVGGDVRAPIFYDSNDTYYYLNPASTSRLNHGNFISTLSFGSFSTGIQGTLFEGYSTHSVVRTDSARLDFYMGKTTTGVGTMMSLTDTGNVGIGTTSPTDYKLDVVNTNDGTTGIGPFRVSAQANAGTVAVFENTVGINTSLKISDTVDDMYVVSRNGIMGLGPSGGWSSNNLNITSAGQVGIGNRNPSERLHVKNGNLRVDTGRINFYEGSANRGYVGPFGTLLNISSTSKIVFRTGANQIEKMRLTDDGRLLLNAPDNASATNSRFEVIGTSSDSTTNLTFKTSGRIGLGDYNPEAKITVVGTTNPVTSNLVKIQNTSNTGSVVDFRNSVGNQAGKISMPSSTTVNYGTTSDYRLKTNVVDLENGVEKVKKLKPSRFEWIENGIEVDGFIAHEVAEVVPEAVTGVKDAVDENNNPVYQDLDYSKVIPVLTAALKEAIQKIELLETRIQTLENK